MSVDFGTLSDSAIGCLARGEIWRRTGGHPETFNADSDEDDELDGLLGPTTNACGCGSDPDEDAVDDYELDYELAVPTHNVFDLQPVSDATADRIDGIRRMVPTQNAAEDCAIQDDEADMLERELGL